MLSAFTFRDAISYISLEIKEFWFNMPFKLTIASLISIFTYNYIGNISILHIYIGIMICDFFVGSVSAYKQGTFKITVLLPKFMFKTLTTFGIIVLILTTSLSYSKTFENEIPFINYILFIFTCCDVISIIYHMEKMGCPIHPFIKFFMVKIRRKAFLEVNKKLSRSDEKELSDEDIDKIFTFGN
jgi:hypothetical protein